MSTRGALGRYQLDYDWAYYEELRPYWETIFPALKGQQVSRAWAASIRASADAGSGVSSDGAAHSSIKRKQAPRAARRSSRPRGNQTP